MNLINAHYTTSNINPVFKEFANNTKILELPELNIYITKKQAENIFHVMDKELHKETYSDLEDKVFDLSDNLDVANEALTTLREIARGE